jgi:DNA primase small subunit
MDPFSQEFVKRRFYEFYSNPTTILPLPKNVSQREFAFFLFRERIMVRHRSAANPNELRRLIRSVEPSDVYYSCAYYENPEAEMEKKGWLGADLVFDIDADHIPTSCDKAHDEWTCKNCRSIGKGAPPEKCEKCGGQKFDTKTWPCEQCINSAKDETSKLIKILKDDFGLSGNDLHVFFSGHRGYHVHVENETVQTLDSIARKEIVDYVLGLGLAALKGGKKNEHDLGRDTSRDFHLHDFGWENRLKEGMRNFILNATPESLEKVGIRNSAIVENKDVILKRCLDEGRWDSIFGVSISSKTAWIKIARHIRDLESAKIDTVVTTDIHRLIRMNGTLHGKSGLLKVEFPAKRLADFDPFREAVAFKDGTAQVSVHSTPEFRIDDTMYGPYKNEIVELPMAAAVFLICKGRAEVVKD